MFLIAKYGTSLTFEFPMIKRGVVDYAVSADWTPSSTGTGDVRISKDGGASANTTNLPTALTMGNGAVWQLTLTATEMQAARIVVTIVDAATKAVEDQAIMILTCGNASAWFINDLTAAQYAANATQWLGTAILTPAVAGTPDVNAKQVGGTAQTGRDLGLLASVRTGTAQAGASSSITLDSGASATNDLYKNLLVFVTGGTGIGQVRIITGYVGSTKVATVTPAWATNPDATSTFSLIPGGIADVEALGGAAGTFSGGRPEVNATHWAGTAVGSAAIRANVIQILGTGVTETVAGRLAGAFSVQYDVGSPVFTNASVNQSGDSFGLIGANGAGLTSLAPASTALSTAVWTATLAGYLANLNTGGVVASQADINALNQSASRRVTLVTVPQYEQPEASSATYTIEARTYDGDGAAVNADTTPTLTATGIVSGSLAANLSAATNPATGVYRWTYTVATGATQEQIRFDLSATISASTFTMSTYSQVVDEVSQTWTSTNASQLAAIFNKLPTKSYLVGTNNTDGDVQLDEATGTPANSAGVTSLIATIGSPAGATIAADIAAVKTDTGTLTSRITSTLFSGITSLAQWLGLMAGKQTGNSTARTEIRATGVGSGTYDETTDSQEATVDRGNAAWVTGSGGGGGGTGSGAYTLTIAVNDGTTVLQNASVRLTEGVTDLVGTTDVNGQVVFSVDAATWNVAITKSGYQFTPTTLAVSGAASQTYSMTQVSVTPNPDPDKSDVTITCYGANTEVEPGATLYVRQITEPSGDEDHSFNGAEIEYTANESGVVTLTLWAGAKYEIHRGDKRWMRTITPAAGTDSLASFVGRST